MVLVWRTFADVTYSGNEIGPFRAVEESTIAHLSPPEHRNHIFAWYALIGTAGTALGLMTCGWATTLLQHKAHYSTVEAYRTVFFAYAVLGLFKFLLTLLLSAQCEAEVQPKSANATETAPLLNGDGDNDNSAKKKKKKPGILAKLPNLSTESKVILVQLCILFAFDNFGSGLATMYAITKICVKVTSTILLIRLQVLGHLLLQETLQHQRRPARNVLLQHQYCASCIGPGSSVNRQTVWKRQNYGIYASTIRHLSSYDWHTNLPTPGNVVRGTSRFHAIHGHGTSIGLPVSSSAPQRTYGSHGNDQCCEDSESKSWPGGNRVPRRQRSLLGCLPACRMSQGNI